MKLAIRIILLTTACLMISSCGKTMEDKIIGKWSHNLSSMILTIHDNGTLTIHKMPYDNKSTTFTSYESDGFLFMDVDGESVAHWKVSFYSDDQIKISLEDSYEPWVFSRIK